MKSWVKCNGEWVDLKKMKFLDISEDEYGRDTVTFEDKDGNTHESLVVIRNYPPN